MERRAYFQSFAQAAMFFRQVKKLSNYASFYDVRGGHKVEWHQS
jgi:hypothetical protein